MEATMECLIEASMAMVRGMQNLMQSLSHSIIVIIISNHMEDMVSPITATMDMARGLLNLNLMQMLTLRPFITMAIIPGVMVEVTGIIVTSQAMGMGLPMAMARGMPRQKLKLSIPTTMDLMQR